MNARTAGGRGTDGQWSVSGLEIRQVNTETGRAWVIKLRNSLC